MLEGSLSELTRGSLSEVTRGSLSEVTPLPNSGKENTRSVENPERKKEYERVANSRLDEKEKDGGCPKLK